MVGRNSRIFLIHFIICPNFHNYFNFKIPLHDLQEGTIVSIDCQMAGY